MTKIEGMYELIIIVSSLWVKTVRIVNFEYLRLDKFIQFFMMYNCDKEKYRDFPPAAFPIYC